MNRPKYLLDSYALLAYFQAEPAGAKVRNILKEAAAGAAKAFLSVINLGEIYYIVARKRGETEAGVITEAISRLPVGLVDATKERVLAAARVKAQHPVSYADAFVVATAIEFTATIVTGDPDFKETESRAAVLWL
ncbi:MAG: type II toxin-antitoxin system VapC family toxin [Syntrophaceae bacterium]|nr:type II toxin-antitoxin system VapC family toxin [Patescibacteria group bacterium]MCG2741091.1 type II toxin-antitoxin system VapC family toxin [Syntrophaceae bacterium]